MFKREPSIKDKKIQKFLLEQQLPDAKVATLGPDGKTVNNSITALDDSIAVTAADHVTQVALETCRCVHLQEHLPHILDLELCKAVHHPRGWVVANPVHSMHLSTQLEEAVPPSIQTNNPPVLYGEEQQRTIALGTEGIVEYWCPLDGYSAVIHDDTAIKKMEHMPTLHNIHPASSAMDIDRPSTATPILQLQQPMATNTSTVSRTATPVVAPSNGISERADSAPGTSSAINSNDPANKASTAKIESQNPTVLRATESASGSQKLPDTFAKDAGPDNASPNASDTTTKNAPDTMTDASPEPAPQVSNPITVDESEDVSPSAPKSAEIDHKQEATVDEQNEVPSHSNTDPEKASGDKEQPPAPESTQPTVGNSTQSSAAGDKSSDVSSRAKEGPTSKTVDAATTKDEGENSATDDKRKGDSSPAMDKSEATDGIERSNLGIDDEQKNDKDQRQDKQNGDVPVKVSAGQEDLDKKEGDSKGSSGKKTVELLVASPLKKVDETTVVKQSSDSNMQHYANNPPTMDVTKKADSSTDDKQNSTMLVGDEVEKVDNTTSGATDLSSAATKPAAASQTRQPDLSSPTPDINSSTGVLGSTPDLPTSNSQRGEDVQTEEKDNFNHLFLEEERIRLIRRSLSSHRIISRKKTDAKKKRKREDLYKTPGIPGWRASPPKELTLEQERQWIQASAASHDRVERWMESYRWCRQRYWDARNGKKPMPSSLNGNFYLPEVSTSRTHFCEGCEKRKEKNRPKHSAKPRRIFSGDDTLQCLECRFVGCAPRSTTPDSKQHILQHLLTTGHRFAVSCGERGQLFCFCCGDFVYHEVFEREKRRIDCAHMLPLMAWKDHRVYRSFDPFQFLETQDHGIVWKGLIATFPQLIPQEHALATDAVLYRQMLFDGDCDASWLGNRPSSLLFASSQALLDDETKCRIVAPVGMYNLGNTCFKSAVLQCLMHCVPLQKFFLKDYGHHHHACKVYRKKEASKRKKKKTGTRVEDLVCLACEMDKLFLSYYGSTIGQDVLGAVHEACDSNGDGDLDIKENLEKGDPLVITEMLTASWKSGGMNSLTGYKQHDAHEFLNSFLDLMGRQTKLYWDRVHASINSIKYNSAVASPEVEDYFDISKRIFEGSLNSVLLCEECGTKRKRTEEFLNVSLSLSEEVERMQSATGGSSSGLRLETCLEHFVSAEQLVDSVDCPSCAKKTSTKKQHTFATLPKVLCLHLKRFDAAQGKKIEDFVSFPAKSLNMGKFLPQWCEVTSVQSTANGETTEPEVLYDLFGTVNHTGNMQSGHYVTNVKVRDKWYHCNDEHISLAGGTGDEASVLDEAGAYILFYIRST